jgi:hypothetical protein
MQPNVMHTGPTSPPACCHACCIQQASSPCTALRHSSTYRGQQCEQVWQWRLPACGQCQCISQEVSEAQYEADVGGGNGQEGEALQNMKDP